MAAIDALALLRQTYSEGGVATLSNNVLSFSNGARLGAETLTNWPSEGNRYYSLGELWALIDNARRNGSELDYSESCANAKLGIVAFADRADVKSYFFGFSSRVAAIETAFEVEFSEEKLENDLLCLRKWENRSDVSLSAMRTSKNFEFCIELLERVQTEREKSTDPRVIGDSTNVISRILSSSTSSLDTVRPIIVVPSEAFAGNISLSNAEAFLARGVYLPATPGSARHFSLKLTVLDRKVEFDVYDNLHALRDKRKLGRVVALFLSGDQHQFRHIEAIWKEQRIAKLFYKSLLNSSRVSSHLL